MLQALPFGDPVAEDGELPDDVVAELPHRSDVPFGLYVHVPFCSVRCGYCDFNTYTTEDFGPGASRASYAQTLSSELDLAHSVLERADAPRRRLSTVFFGGGTPTLLPAADLAAMLERAKELFGVVPGAEITTEANPDTVTPQSAETLAAAGFTRLSIGMQSAVPHVLKTLDRTHDPRNIHRAVEAARAAGLQVSLDLIYGTPGETLQDWRRSLDTAIAEGPDHISAYSLIVESGTAMAAKIRRGTLPDIDPDDQADKYLLTEDVLSRAGYRWYEVSNFSTSGHTRSQHNLNYWLDTDWWGAGPGAHSHMAGLRWWNVKHPLAYAQRLRAGASPGHAQESLTAEERKLEHLMLRLRLADGLDIAQYNAMPGGAPVTASQLRTLQGQGLLADAPLTASPEHPEGRAVLTVHGRLLADAVIRSLSE